MSDALALRCFLAIPLSQEFRHLRQLISSSLEEIGIEPISFEEAASPPGAASIFARRAIERTDLVIADLTGDDPNVMYEVGFAQALGKAVFPIVRYVPGGRVPDAIAGQLVLVYDSSRPAKLREDIKIWVPRYLKRSSAVSRAS